MYGYKIEIPATPGMVYIGQTKDIETRWKGHCSPNNASLISRALQAYGPGTITKIFTATSKEELDRWEIDTIKSLGTIYPGGYNLHEGGKGCRWGGHSYSMDVTVADEQEEQDAYEKKTRKKQPAEVEKIEGNIKYMKQVVKTKNVYLEHVNPAIMKGGLGYGLRANKGDPYRKVSARSGSDWSNYVESVLGKWHRNKENNGIVNVWDLSLKEWADLEQRILWFFNRGLTPSLTFL